ncbi:MAG: SdiA-regulated domain-containing protein [Candidatus Brocadiales bacterium]
MTTLRFMILLWTSFLFSESVFATEYKLLQSFPVDVEEPSGLTYDPQTDTLWTVQDGGGGLCQLDTHGKVINTIDIPSNDLEGIAYKPGSDTFLLAEERNREILEVDRQGTIIQAIMVPIKWRLWHLNYGIEGVSYFPKSRHIFIVNEKGPRVLMELNEGGAVVQSFEVEGVEDLSGIYCNDASGDLLIISHESKKVMELTSEGRLISSFAIDIPQAEGITKDGSGNIYIICENSKTLYIYAPVEK